MLHDVDLLFSADNPTGDASVDKCFGVEFV